MSKFDAAWSKSKAVLRGVMDIALECYWTATDWIERHPHLTFWVIVVLAIVAVF